MGPSPWSERMIGIIDDIWKHAAIETPYGKIPTLNFEVCGDLLQANSRLYWFTGRPQVSRLGHPPGRLLPAGHEPPHARPEAAPAGRSRLRSDQRPHGTLRRRRPGAAGKEAGLPEADARDVRLHPGEGPQRGRPALFLVQSRRPASTARTCATPGATTTTASTRCGCSTKPRPTATPSARRWAISKANTSAPAGATRAPTAYADSIEGAINLFNREPVDSAADWIDSQTRMMWAIQKARRRHRRLAWRRQLRAHLAHVCPVEDPGRDRAALAGRRAVWRGAGGRHDSPEP